MPVTIMAKNYAHCPLKKRPVPTFEEIPDEPENLSTKPEDLSRSARSVANSPAPVSTESPVSPPSSIITSSPPSSPPMSPQSPRIGAPSPPLHYGFYSAHKSESAFSDFAPQTWHRSVAAPLYPPAYGFLPHYAGYHYEPTSPYSDSSLSPPHQGGNIVAPIAIRRDIYQASLSPSSSTQSPSPPMMHLHHPEDLSNLEKRGRLQQQGGPSGAIRHQCPDCGKSYSTFSGLSKHRQFHCAAGDGPKKTFSCKYCEKVYVSLGALKMHIRTHTLPCKCTICGKAFSRPWLLQGHIRTHTGEKPFSCTYCNRAFADRSNLRAHLQTHSDVKKYSCTSCSKTFSRMSLLTKHAESGCTGGPIMPCPSEKMVY